MSKQTMKIPTFVANSDFEPARIFPTLYFYNGTLETDEYRVDKCNFENCLSTTVTEEQSFPYFDHYSSGSANNFPTTGSESLLFLNEEAAYGIEPSETLYTKYWETYVELLYNPVTRLINAEANIPIAEYFKLELNDIVEFRGNYYHLRAINDYNLSTGDCRIELLGPIIDDTLDTYFSSKV